MYKDSELNTAVSYITIMSMIYRDTLNDMNGQARPLTNNPDTSSTALLFKEAHLAIRATSTTKSKQ